MSNFLQYPQEEWFKKYGPDEITLIEKALYLAIFAHLGQKDKAGIPYIFHSLRVMLQGKTEEEMALGISHDVIEDTDIDEEDYRNDEFPEEFIKSLLAITHRKGEPREMYYDRIKKDELAWHVKEYDIEDNLSPNRLFKLKDRAARTRLIEKYGKAIDYLGYEDEERFN